MSPIGDFFAEAADLGKLIKLRIVAFEDPEQDSAPADPTGRAKESGDSFEAFFNPSGFSTNYGITYNTDATLGDTVRHMPFKEYTPTTYTFDLLLDGTGASIPEGIYKNNRKSVPEMLDIFKKVTYGYRGPMHRPAFLRLEWGLTSVPRCVLNSAAVKYDLFDVAGTPLRATISCSFTEYITPPLKEADKKNQSPDLTHVRVVQQGDRLPLMCERIYGDGGVYLEVARFNNLSNYRNLQPGQKIFFPPLVKAKS